MDYLRIVFDGFANPNSREYLDDYFFREFKKAEKEHFKSDEFFNGCIKVIEALESEMDKRLYERKHELYLMQDLAEACKLNESDNTKTLEQRQKEMVTYCENELAQISRYNFPVNLLHYTSNRFMGDFYENDAFIIKEAIFKAKIKTFTVNEKVEYYKEQKWNIPFRELHHTVITVCDFVKPIFPNVEPLKYIEYFFNNIDFDKIDKEATKTETLKYCNAIYYGLEQLLKADISNEILNYQNSISKLSKEKVRETQIILIELIGNLKRQARNTQPGISFTQRYNSLYKSIESKESLFSIDYQILIAEFNETVLNDLLSSFEIINETFKEIIPLLKALPLQQNKTKTEQINSDLGFVKQHLEALKNIFSSDAEYSRAVQLVAGYFLGEPLGITTPIFVKSGNIKNLAFSLGEIWRNQRNEVISFDYLKFYKNSFSIFSRQIIDEHSIFGSNLYKYSISKT